MADEDLVRVSRDPESEKIRQWVNKNAAYMVAGVVLGLGGVFGFNYWQDHRDTQATQASLLFERLSDALEADAAEPASEPDAATATESAAETESAEAGDVAEQSQAPSEVSAIARTLMSDYGSTEYALHGALVLAKQAVENDDLAGAAEALQWANENADDEILQHIIRLRLASVWLAQENAAEVIALLEKKPSGAFATRYHELSGDAYLLQGDPAAARTQYQLGIAAYEANAEGNVGGKRWLELKLHNIGEIGE